jgi:hypothetical protein
LECCANKLLLGWVPQVLPLLLQLLLLRLPQLRLLLMLLLLRLPQLLLLLPLLMLLVLLLLLPWLLALLLALLLLLLQHEGRKPRLSPSRPSAARCWPATIADAAAAVGRVLCLMLRCTLRQCLPGMAV